MSKSASLLFAVVNLADALRFEVESDMEKETTDEVQVEVLFVRHGHACHNALKHQGSTMGGLNHCRYLDPPLTDCGLKHSQENGVELATALTGLNWTPHMVSSSALLRTMETAHAMFPSQTIYPLPFINEKGHGRLLTPCNSPDSIANQTVRLTASAVNVDFKWLQSGSGDLSGSIDLNDTRLDSNRRNWDRDDARTAVKYKEFQAYLGQYVVPELLSQNKAVVESSGRKSVRIAIVSHSNFLKYIFEKYMGCPNYFQNNGARFVAYSYNKDAADGILKIKTDGITCQSPIEREEGVPQCAWSKIQSLRLPKRLRALFRAGRRLLHDGMERRQCPAWNEVIIYQRCRPC